LKGCRIQRLPPVLTLCLSRFELDYTTFQRKKVNAKFEYPLELNMADYLDEMAVEDERSTQYELKAIIIHRGGAYGGHYHAYIQDDLGEGDRHL
jgi:ubiquitin carboxyl-terminal hydrolase 40